MERLVIVTVDIFQLGFLPQLLELQVADIVLQIVGWLLYDQLENALNCFCISDAIVVPEIFRVI